MAVKKSLITLGKKWILELDSDPSVGIGFDAPVGSMASVLDATWIKYGAGDTQWRDYSDEIFDFLQLTEQSIPSAPASGLIAYAKSYANRQILTQIGKSGLEYPFQASLAMNPFDLYRPIGNTNTVSSIGVRLGTSGTATTRNVALTNFFTAMKRIGYVSSGAAGNSSAVYSRDARFARGNSDNIAGFYSVFRFGIGDAAAVAQGRMFVGMTSSVTTLGNSDPTSFFNVLGLGSNSADTNLKIIHNDGSGLCTEVDLGSNFPANTRSVDVFELIIYATKNSSEVHFQVRNLSTDAIFNHTASTNIPSPTQLLSWQLWRNNGTTSSSVGLDVMSVYVETDN